MGGRCPSCRKYIRCSRGGEYEVTERRAKCVMCCRTKVIIDRGRCDACLLGDRYDFEYECSGCHRRQRIPHPMWRYQPSPEEFGTCSWACHRGCHTYTRWRISPQAAEQIPLSEVPESWGRQEDWLAS